MKQKEKRTRPANNPAFDPYDLKSLPTRLLLSYLRSYNAECSLIESTVHEIETLRGQEKTDVQPLDGYAPVYNGRKIPIIEIRDELAKREHVMNKAEGSAYRRACATKNHGSKKLKRA